VGGLLLGAVSLWPDAPVQPPAKVELPDCPASALLAVQDGKAFVHGVGECRVR